MTGVGFRCGGAPGTIVLTTKDCFNGKCDWYGDFTSDDGRVRFPGAAMQEGVPAGAKVGDRLPALDTGARDGVFPRTGSTEWVYVAMFLGLSLFVLLGDVALCFLVPVLLRRRLALRLAGQGRHEPRAEPPDRGPRTA